MGRLQAGSLVSFFTPPGDFFPRLFLLADSVPGRSSGGSEGISKSSAPERIKETQMNTTDMKNGF